MTTTNSLYPIVRSLSPAPLVQKFGNLAALGALVSTLSKGRNRGRDRNLVVWVVGGVALGAAATFLIASATGRDLGSRLLAPFQRTGGGLGKWLGQVVGKQVGAHPVETTKLVQGARDALGSHQP